MPSSAADHVIVVTPNYQSLHSLPAAPGATVTKIDLDEDGGWTLDLDAVRSAIRPETTLIVGNVPNGPTGSLFSRATFDGLLEIAREAGARIFSDKVYRFLEFDPHDQLPAAADADASALSLGVLSKSFGLAGLRIGWIATREPKVYSRLVSFKHYLTICNAAPSEVLATIALRARDPVLARVRGIFETNLAVLNGFMQRRSDLARWVRPKAGTVGFVQLLARHRSTSSPKVSRAKKKSCCCPVQSSITPATTSGSGSAAPTCRTRSSASRVFWTVQQSAKPGASGPRRFQGTGIGCQFTPNSSSFGVSVTWKDELPEIVKVQISSVS